MIGFVLANIVGLQYYSGQINGREMVGLIREPLNPHDKNAIKVLNTRTEQVGHIERSVAAVLAPLVDKHLIIIEGIVPNTRNSGNKFKIPCQIHIFVRLAMCSSVRSSIQRAGLVLILPSDPSFALSEAEVVKEKMTGREVKTLDEIFKLVDENVSKKAKMEAMEPPKQVIKSQLFQHQKEALGWLFRMENSDDLPPFWEEEDGEFINVLTNYRTEMRPEPLRGGIFADDMGLGKTLTLLSLIALDKYRRVGSSVADRNVAVENINDDKLSDRRKRKRSVVIKKDSEGQKENETEDDKLVKRAKEKIIKCSGIKTTLIVCSPSVISTWVTQLEEHTVPGGLKVYLYYGERTQQVEELQQHDIVLTTYGTLAIEEPSEKGPAKNVNWWRVIVDEGHMIKNVNAQQSRAVANLSARHRWVVTGTPIQNGSFDLFSLMSFLQFEPFSIRSYWRRLIQRPLDQGNKKALSRLQVLMATISLRRTKDKALIGLPHKTVETCYVELSEEERDLYDHMEREAKGLVQSLISGGRLMHNYSAVLTILLRLRQICTDMALCPPDLKSSTNIEDVSNNPELLKKLVAVLQDGEDFDCPICLSPPSITVITSCAHIFCQTCILKTIERSKSSCPLCRHPLSQSDLFTAPPESSDADNRGISSHNQKSSKVSALLKLLIASRDENPNTKSVIFSQFRKMLLLLEEPLKVAGFKILRLDGSMTATRRAKVIKDFSDSEPGEPTVLLASLKASGTGINLTAASRVYLLEPWWNPAVEEQAMDRVHRIGQKEEVKVVRLIAKNSIEERILVLQEKKRNLARKAFQGKAKDRREVSIDDVRTLMSL